MASYQPNTCVPAVRTSLRAAERSPAGAPPSPCSHRSTTASAVSRSTATPVISAVDVRQRQVLGAALGQEAAERVVEAPGGGRGPQALLPGHRGRRQLPVTADHAERHRAAQVAGASRRTPRPPPRRTPSGAARPEQHADDEADRTADRDVLDPDQADLPAGRRDDVVQDQQRDGEGRLARGEGDDGRRQARQQDSQRAAGTTARCCWCRYRGSAPRR